LASFSANTKASWWSVFSLPWAISWIRPGWARTTRSASGSISSTSHSELAVAATTAWEGPQAAEEGEDGLGIAAGEGAAGDDAAVLVEDRQDDRLLVEVDADEVHGQAPGSEGPKRLPLPQA
jgi:hypothetical protein